MEKSVKILYLIRRFIKKDLLSIGILSIVQDNSIKKALRISIEEEENINESINVRFNSDLIDFRKKGQTKKIYNLIVKEISREYERLEERKFAKEVETFGYDPVIQNYLKKLN